MESTHHDVIVIGGGIAGLAAAWKLRDSDVLLLEKRSWIGGRLRSVSRDPYWVNLGAHLFGGPQGIATRMARDAGVECAVPQGSLANVAVNGRIVRGGEVALFPLQLPISIPARVSLIRVGLRLKLAELRARRACADGQTPGLEGPVSLDRFPVNEKLDAKTFREVLGPMHPKVEALMRIIANRITGELETLSGHHGALYALEAAAGHPRPVPMGGMGLVSDRIRMRLGKRVQTDACVKLVKSSGAAVHIDVDVEGVRRNLSADYCIVAVPAPVVLDIVVDLPKRKVEALKRVRYAPWVVAGLFTNEEKPMPWDDMYAMGVPEASFSFFFNNANPLRTRARRAPGGSLVLYTAGDQAADLFRLDDADIRERFVHDLVAIFPQAEGIIEDVFIQRWPYGGPIVWPGRARIQDLLIAPHRRLYFAGDYLMCSGVDFAAWTGIQAARKVMACQRNAESWQAH